MPANDLHDIGSLPGLEAGLCFKSVQAFPDGCSERGNRAN
jgi:hypothetical protein